MVAPQKLDSIRGCFLRVTSRRAHTERLALDICEDVQDRTKNPVQANSIQLLPSSLGDILGQFLRACGCEAHGTGELSNIDLIEEAIEPAIFLFERDEEGNFVARLVGDVLQIKNELSGLFCRYQ
jgi:hypothetical protein